MTQEPAYIRAERKITDTTSWRGDVNISLGEESVTFKHRLLNEGEFLEVKQALNLSELGGDNAGQTETQERLLELQQKEDLSESEENELQELTQEVAQQTDQIERALGEDGYDLLMKMGKKTIKPSDEDVEYVYNMSPSEMKQHLGVSTLPNPVTKDVVREHMEERLQEMITDQPYPIKLNVGMQALSETLSVLGNGSQK